MGLPRHVLPVRMVAYAGDVERALRLPKWCLAASHRLCTAHRPPRSQGHAPSVIALT